MYKVEIWTDDPDFYLIDQPDKMNDWALDNCHSYLRWEQVDMSDFNSSNSPDTGNIYYFNDEQDALLFSLKFQGVM